VVVFEPEFSDRMDRCSFLADPGYAPVNPLGRDGVRLDRLALTVLRDPTQRSAAAIIEQATQVTLFRVTIPYMIGQAFGRVGDERFMEVVATKLRGEALRAEVLQELDPAVQKLLAALFADPKFEAMLKKEFGTLGAAGIKSQMPGFRKLVREALNDKEVTARVAKELTLGEVMTPTVRKDVGPPVKSGVSNLFPNYDFNALTWPDLTKTTAREGNETNRAAYAESDGSGVLKRGALRYQVLVPSYTVMFAFFLVLTVGWLFVTERKHGTLLRLRAAPLGRGQILLGKLLPCLVVSLVQGFFVLLAGKLVFGMNWGPEPWLLVPVVVCTSVAAVGLAMLVASVAKTETQVAVYGTLLVLVLGGVSGSLMPRDLMPEQMKQISLVTPHAWALDAYAQLLANPSPEASVVWTSCLALLGFGAAFLALAWWRLDLE
jgi:ABC-type transport system involved in multi-copper enzyme maturation permease subunit